MQNLRLALVVAALGSAAAAGCSSGSGTDASLRVRNDSHFAIVEIHVTPVGNPNWGPNLIDVDLLPGNMLTVDVSCSHYDALLVDESGVSCEVHDLDLCFSTADWVIRDDTCPVFGAAKAARDAANAAGSGSASGGAH
jgi:hypothetical protein